MAALADSNFLAFSFHGPDEQGKLCLSSERRSRPVVAQTVILPNGTDHLMICGGQACQQQEFPGVTADDIRPRRGLTAGRRCALKRRRKSAGRMLSRAHTRTFVARYSTANAVICQRVRDEWIHRLWAASGVLIPDRVQVGALVLGAVAGVAEGFLAAGVLAQVRLLPRVAPQVDL